MCAFCRQNALFAEYSEVMASDDFPEIVELFGQRIAEQAQKTHIELNKPRIQGIDDRPITAEGCIPISHEDDLHGKIVVIKPEVLRREYRGPPASSSSVWAALGLLHTAGGPPVTALTSIPEKKAAMNAWTCWARYSRRICPAGPSMALTRSSRNRLKRKQARSVSDDGLQRKCRIYHYGFLSCGRQRICPGRPFGQRPSSLSPGNVPTGRTIIGAIISATCFPHRKIWWRGHRRKCSAWRISRRMPLRRRPRPILHGAKYRSAKRSAPAFIPFLPQGMEELW